MSEYNKLSKMLNVKKAVQTQIRQLLHEWSDQDVHLHFQ